MMKILSNKPTITRRELEGVLDCLIKDELAAGSSVKAFEASLADIIGQKFCLAVNSPTAAYYLAFRALKLTPESEVIIPAYSPPAPLSALLMAGARPVLADCEEGAVMPSADIIKSLVTENTRAVVVCHTFGFPAPAEELACLPVPVIEDISCAIGTSMDGVAAGKTASFAVISFAPEMLITTGSGGAVLTSNSQAFSAMRELRSGETSLNMDCAMTDFQGAMGSSQLIRLKDFLKRRREIAGKFCDAVRLTSHKIPYPYNADFGWQTFPVIFDASEDRVLKYWKKNGVEAASPIRPLYEYTGGRPMDFPNTERLARKLYTVPLYPTLTHKEIEQVAKLLASFI